MTFILKNPPNTKPEIQGSSLTKGKVKRSKRSRPNGEANGEQEEHSNESVGLDTSTNDTQSVDNVSFKFRKV